ncbi:MAG: hypothetical protein U0401_30365 [Anaerolineae bacterium]
MTGMYLDDCPGLSSGSDCSKIWQRRVLRQVLRHLITHYLNHNNLRSALRYSYLLEIDPGEREGHRQQMMILARSDQRIARPWLSLKPVVVI